jgi:hypothetical protein
MGSYAYYARENRDADGGWLLYRPNSPTRHTPPERLLYFVPTLYIQFDHANPAPCNPLSEMRAAASRESVLNYAPSFGIFETWSSVPRIICFKESRPRKWTAGTETDKECISRNQAVSCWRCEIRSLQEGVDAGQRR